jgi:hypothetical protein
MDEDCEGLVKQQQLYQHHYCMSAYCDRAGSASVDLSVSEIYMKATSWSMQHIRQPLIVDSLLCEISYTDIHVSHDLAISVVSKILASFSCS